MIRITGGKNRSRLLDTPEGTLTKPTMDRVREAIFSALGDKVIDAKVLDLFAGSGSYGFESLSRGAKCATFVDKSHEAYKAIFSNAKKLKEDNVKIVFGDSLNFIKEKNEKFDIVFVDPPYKLEVYEDIVKTLTLNDELEDGGIIVLESERELEFDKSSFREVRFYKYGIAKVYILRK